MENVVGTMSSTDEISYDHSYFYICKKCNELKDEILKLKSEITTLKKQLSCQTKENRKLCQNLEDLYNPNPSLPRNKKLRDDITQNTLELSGLFGTGQIDIAIRGAADKTKIETNSHFFNCN